MSKSLKEPRIKAEKYETMKNDKDKWEQLVKYQKLEDRYEAELDYLRLRNMEEDGELVVCSNAMEQLSTAAVSLFKKTESVLLVGEQGTGKEILADFIYKNSRRSGKAFIKVDCSALGGASPEADLFGFEEQGRGGKSIKIGFLELANRGTLVLKNIHNMPLAVQSQLSRALYEKVIIRIRGNALIPVDFNVIATTDKDLKGSVENGKFCEDLYTYLTASTIYIPPLRARRGDIDGLVTHFVEKFSRKYGVDRSISPAALDIFKNYEWPGNTGELKNAVERMMMIAEDGEIGGIQARSVLLSGTEDGRFHYSEGEQSLEEIVNQYEKEILICMMEKYKTAAAVCKILSVNKSTMSRKLRKYHVEQKNVRDV